MHQGRLAQILRDDFVIVHIGVGRFDKNQDVAAQYHVPLRFGIPALAVLDPRGNLLYAQEHGEFEAAHQMTEAAFLQFFEKWAPQKPPVSPLRPRHKSPSPSARPE